MSLAHGPGAASCVASYPWPQHKPRPLAPTHLERRHALDTEADVCVGYFDLARRRRRNLVGHDSMPARERMSHKVVIGHLKEGTHGGWLVAVSAGPGADCRQRRENISIGPEKEIGPTGIGPYRQFVSQRST